MTREIASLGECRFRISNIHQNSMGKVDISTKSLFQNKHNKSLKTDFICHWFVFFLANPTYTLLYRSPSSPPTLSTTSTLLGGARSDSSQGTSRRSSRFW